jgi:hypothetical protein
MEPQQSPRPSDPQQPQYPPVYQGPEPHQAYGQAPQSVPPKQHVPTPGQPNPHPSNLHPMVILQPGERVVAIIKRHPFGIVSMYVACIIGILVAAGLAFYLLPRLLDQYGTGDANIMVYSGLAIVVAGMVLILGIATSVYWQNQWTVTTDSITQITQKSLFTRQVSQLSMDNLEDVTVDQNGIIPHLFNYGTLKVESAGERSKFQFPYCPSPNEYARRILEAHEQFLEDRRNIQNVP